MLPAQTAPVARAESQTVLPDIVKHIIVARMIRQESAPRIAALIEQNFHIKVDREQMLACWHERKTPPIQTEPIQTERREDKESVQFPADEPGEPLFTRMPEGETPPVISPSITSASTSAALPQTPPSIPADPGRFSVAAPEADAPTTQTGRRQNADSPQIPADTVDEPTVHDHSIQALADLARARLGIPQKSATATQTGRRQNQKIVLTDEIKAFIVRGLARYETPTQIAAAMKENFGIEITRRQVFSYDPAGSRPPAQRWIDLHAATRAKFLQAMAEIGITQKLVRLRMLDRYANRADEYNQMERAAAFLDQAAKECGGFYERYQRPKAA